MTLPLGRTYPVERGPDGRLIVDLAKCPPGRSQEEMQITLARLADVFGVDTTTAQGLAGAELAAWLEALRRELPPHPETDIFRMVLTGETEEPPRLDALYDALSPDCFYLELQDRTTRDRKSVV